MGGEWSTPLPILYTPEEETPSTYCTGGWVGPSAGLDRRRKSRPHRAQFNTISNGLLTDFKTSSNKTHLQNGYNEAEHPNMTFTHKRTSNPKNVCTQFVRSRQSKQLVRTVPFCSLWKRKMLHINLLEPELFFFNFSTPVYKM